MYGIETVTTGAATVGTGVVVTAAVVLEVLVLEVADVLEVEDEEVEEVTEVGVPAGQSEPASAGGVHPIISKKTGEHWAPRLAS